MPDCLLSIPVRLRPVRSTILAPARCRANNFRRLRRLVPGFSMASTTFDPLGNDETVPDDNPAPIEGFSEFVVDRPTELEIIEVVPDATFPSELLEGCA